jgi:hypothetical protein
MNKQHSQQNECLEGVQARLDWRINRQAVLTGEAHHGADTEQTERDIDRNLGAIEELTEHLRSLQVEAEE